MKISWKILVIALPLLVVGMLAVGWMNGSFAEQALDELAADWLDSRLSDAMSIAARTRNDLRRPESTLPVAAAKETALKSMGAMNIGRGGLVLVIDGSGRVLAAPDGDRVGRNVATAPWFRAMLGRPRGALSLELAGKRYLGAFDLFQPWGWHVLAAASEDDIHGPARKARRYGAAATLAAALLAAALLLLLARRLTAPLYALMDEAERIAAGDLSTPVSVASRDEIGSLAASFQKMKLRLGALYQGLEERIDELKRAENELTQSETRLRRLTDAAWEGIAIHDEGVLLLANARYFTMFGYAPDELIGKQAVNLTIAPKSLPELAKRAANDSSAPFEATGLRKDGSSFALEIRMSRIEYHGRMVRVAALRDITERRASEEALKESEALFRSIISASQDAMVVLDRRGLIAAFNPAAERMFGRAASEMLGKSPSTLIPKSGRRRILRFVGVILKGLTSPSALGRAYEDTALRQNGEEFPVELSVSTAQHKGEIVVLAVIRDISERKRTEEELAALNRRLEELVIDRTRDLADKAEELIRANVRLRELDAMKSSFLSSVSHELRTPLTSILGFTKLLDKTFRTHFWPALKEAPHLERKGRRFMDNLSVIASEGERLTRLINDVLDLNKIESGAHDWRDRFVNPAELISHAARTVRGEIAQSPHVRLKVGPMKNLPGVMADPDRLVQVLINLLNNAAKFTERGTVTVTACTENGELRVSVSDTGKGIPRQDLPKIFDKFQQSRGDTLSGKPKGTGLGLSICKQIVERYGGRIWAESEEGRGSCFTFSLPLQPGGMN